MKIWPLFSMGGREYYRGRTNSGGTFPYFTKRIKGKRKGTWRKVGYME